jgi:hypothetical protein
MDEKYVRKCDAIADGLERFNVAAAKLRGLPDRLANLVPAGADRERLRANVESLIDAKCKVIREIGNGFRDSVLAMPGIDPMDAK